MNMKKLELHGVDEWDRVVFNDNDRKKYVCIYPLWDPKQKNNLEMYLCNLHTVTNWGEPDMPVDASQFELYPYTWIGNTLTVMFD